MWSFILASTLAVGAVPVQVETLEGQKLAGELQAWNADALILKTATGEETVPLARLAQVSPQTSPAAELPAATAWLDLVDGTTLELLSYTVADRQAKVKLRTGSELVIPVKLVASVRLQKLSTPELARQWEQIRQSKPAGDLVVVLKGEALDYLEGVLSNVTDAEVKFKLEGDDISVKRTKLSGIVYFKNAASASASADLKCIVTNLGETRINAQTVSLTDNGSLLLVSQCGVELSLPWDQTRLLDFTVGKVVYLATLTPERIDLESFFPWPAKLPLLEKYREPALNRSLSGGPLRLIKTTAGKEERIDYQRGIALHSKSEVGYRLPGAYRRFKSLAFLDARVPASAQVRLIITGDEKVLLEQDISGHAAPVEVDLDLTGVRRLTLKVDYGTGLDFGDHLDLAESRVSQ